MKKLLTYLVVFLMLFSVFVPINSEEPTSNGNNKKLTNQSQWTRVWKSLNYPNQPLNSW